MSKMVIFCRDSLMRSVDRTKKLIVLNDEIRLNVDMFLYNALRPILRELELAFKPALTRYQWLSKDLEAYLKHLEEVYFYFLIFVSKTTHYYTFFLNFSSTSLECRQNWAISQENKEQSIISH